MESQMKIGINTHEGSAKPKNKSQM